MDDDSPLFEHKPQCNRKNIQIQSVFDLIEDLSININFHATLSNVQEREAVQEIPFVYDGYIAIELPPCMGDSSMVGMKHTNDGHVWASYVTCSLGCFLGVVLLSRFAGHL